MSETTKTYHLVGLQEGDVWYPGVDQRNMRTIDRNLGELFTFAGPGVITGWDVQAMPAITGMANADAPTIAERNSLINAAYGSFLSRQYVGLGSPGLNDEQAWAQCVRVTPGTGIVGQYSALTSQTYYGRYPSPGIYYVWADYGFCLVSEGRVNISFPTDGSGLTRNTQIICTYLATIEVAEVAPVGSGIGYVAEIIYGSQRNELLNFQGALDAALELAFYHHHHLGPPNHPTKINLASEIVLTAKGPAGSTILLLYDANGNAFTGDPTKYGIPSVTVNNVTLPPADYLLQLSAGKLSLMNSLAAGSVVLVYLPLSAQVNLTMWDNSLITDSLNQSPPRNVPIYFTDGSTSTDSSGNTVQVIYTWDDALWLPPKVYLDNVLIDPSAYTIVASAGSINFTTPLTNPPYTNSSLTAILTHIGVEVQGMLSGNAVQDLDASTFVRGTIDPSRINGLDHVGLARYKDKAVLMPYLRALEYGDQVTFYAEALNQAVQYGTRIRKLASSVNISAGNLIIGTNRGIAAATNTLPGNTAFYPNWVNDQGQMVQSIDEVIDDTPPTGAVANYFTTTWMRVDLGPNVPGQVVYSRDGGTSWNALRMPIVEGQLVEPLCFYATTDVQQATTNSGIIKNTYTELLYLGTNVGFWTASILQGTATNEWTWQQADYVEGPVNALAVITTLYTSITTSDDGSSTETQYLQRTVYLGANDGFYVNGTNVSPLTVKGFYWVRDGEAQNNLYWWNDTQVYFTSTAIQVNQSTSDTTTTYWTHPLVTIKAQEVDAVCATTGANITLSGSQTIDGIDIGGGEKVLVKDQTSPTENGLYYSSNGAWSRTSDNILSGNVFVNVVQGSSLAGSRWNVSLSSTPSPAAYGQTQINFTNYWWRVLNDGNAVFTDVCNAEDGFTDFYVTSAEDTTRLWLVNLTYPDNGGTISDTPATSGLTWDIVGMGSPFTMILVPTPSTLTGNSLLVGSDRGLWISRDGGDTWGRCRSDFYATAPPLLFDQITGEELDVSTYTSNFAYQSFNFTTPQSLGTNLLYERDFTNYWVTPWTNSGAEVIVYIGDNPATVNWTTIPSTGEISFVTPLSAASQVFITILRPGAYITGVGVTPHQEIPNVAVTPTTPPTYLAADFVAGATTVIVQNKQALPVTTTYIMLSNGSNSVYLNVVIDPITLAINLTSPNPSQITYPQIVTGVYPVSFSSVLGLDDDISLAMSNQTFNLNSVFIANVLRYMLASRQYASNIFTNFYGSPHAGTVADRGPKNVFFFDSESGQIDPINSVATLSVTLEPNTDDLPVDPVAVTAFGPSVSSSGSGLLVGTDQGLWGYAAPVWQDISTLNNSRTTYFIESAIIGCDKGVFRNSGGVWVADPTFPQPTFDHLDSITWFSGTAEVYAKSDGISFIWSPSGQTGFESDHFDLVDGINSYYVWYAQFRREDSNGDGGYTEVDAVYICAENGLYGITNGSLNRNATYASFLGGREMFGPTPPSTMPTNLKYYGIFQPPMPPKADGSSNGLATQVLILTSAGVYMVINWRWCDPNDGNGLVFVPEGGVGMPGQTCYCFLTGTAGGGTSGIPPQSQVFVGTNRGVYRSFNMGASWQQCERLGDTFLAVYTLVHSGDGILAGTSDGLFYTEDLGDTWFRPSALNSNGAADYPYEITNAPDFSQNNTTSGSLAQTFKPQVGGQVLSDLTSVSLYVDVLIPDGVANPTACGNNTLTVTLCAVNGEGLPSTTLATSSTTFLASEIAYSGFVQFSLPYTISGATSSTVLAIVATETFASGSQSTSVFRLRSSTLDNPYSQGAACQLVGGTWQSMESSRDFYFRATFDAPSTPFTTVNAVDFTKGIARGVTINDNGDLTIDGKIAMVLNIDDSASMDWADTEPSDRRINLPSFISSLWNRTFKSGYQPSWGSIWTYGVQVLNGTNGFTNDVSMLRLQSSALFTTGDSSMLVETGDESIATLVPQGIIDAFFVDSNWPTRVAALVTYLNSRSLLRLAEIVAWWNAEPVGVRSAWEGTSNTISSFLDVSTHLVTRWAAEMTPAFIIVSDGDQTGASGADPNGLATAAESTWDETGIGPICIALGEGSSQGTLRQISATAGRTYVVTSPGDWQTIEQLLQQDGADSLYQGSYSQSYDYEYPTWIEYVQSAFSAPQGSSVTVQAMWSVDRINFSTWVTLGSDVPLFIKQPLLWLGFRVTIQEGWDLGNSVPITPTVSYIEYAVVTPGRTIVETLPQTVGGSVFEYLLTSIADLPNDVQVEWSIIRGSVTDPIYGEPIRVNRKGCLPDRQHSIQFTPEVVQANLATTTSDQQTYQVVNANGQNLTWPNSTIVQVYGDGFLISPTAGSYSVDPALGQIIFTNAQPPALVVTVTLTTPPVLYRNYGEPTTTVDYRTYVLVNGIWSPDSTSVVVLVNNTVVRGGYYLVPASGLVVFYQELNPTDIVTVYIQASPYFRVVAEVLQYGDTDVNLNDFALMCTALDDPTLAQELTNLAATPTVKDLALVPSPYTIYDRMLISYDYISADGSTETTTLTEWWRYRPGLNISGYTQVDGEFVQISATNGFAVDYDNRMTVRLADLGPNGIFHASDQLYVLVAASNGYKTDAFRSSAPAITLHSTQAPYVTNLVINAPNSATTNGITTVPAGYAVTATYNYYDLDNGPDQSTVTWYDHDTSTAYYVGGTIPANMVVSGKVLSFTVLPFDGTMYGVLMRSSDVLVQ